jgi:hypothetical protein
MATSAQREASVEALGVDAGAEATFPRGMVFTGMSGVHPIRLVSNVCNVGDLWQEHYNDIRGNLPIELMNVMMLRPIGNMCKKRNVICNLLLGCSSWQTVRSGHHDN